MKFGNEWQKQLFAECENAGEDEVRLRLNSSAYTPADRQLMESWLHSKEADRNRDFQKTNTSIQTWILRLTIAIFILTLMLVLFAILSYKPLDMYPHSQTTKPQEKDEQQQKGELKPMNKIPK